MTAEPLSVVLPLHPQRVEQGMSQGMSHAYLRDISGLVPGYRNKTSNRNVWFRNVHKNYLYTTMQSI